MSEREMGPFLRHTGTLREKDGRKKEVICLASLKKTVAHTGGTAWGAAGRVGKRDSDPAWSLRCMRRGRGGYLKPFT